MSLESELGKIYTELRRAAGLPVISGSSPAPSSEWALANIYEVVSNWSPGGDSLDLGAVEESIIPAEDDAINLGSAAKRWSKGYYSDSVNVGADYVEEGGLGVVIGPEMGVISSSRLATVGDQVQSPPSIILQGSYWDGEPFALTGYLSLALNAAGVSPEWALQLQSSAFGVLLSFNQTGRAYFPKDIELVEMTAPAAPAANQAKIFCRDNGSGKTQICALFPTGVVQVIATEP